ncbi:hypothetical protein K438DRAFT_1755592 [Mycena galopus ATCC 62051]|nr:hypothetical protein K438DRAFT_1755592 [Mycena galopus ATCC 62051]
MDFANLIIHERVDRSGLKYIGRRGIIQDGTKFLVGSFAGSSSEITGFSPQAIYRKNVWLRGRLFNPCGTPGVSNTVGAALWALNYAFFAPQIGISKLFFHGVNDTPNTTATDTLISFQGIGFKYLLVDPTRCVEFTRSGWIPVIDPLLPHVQPTYYAAVVVAELRDPMKSPNIRNCDQRHEDCWICSVQRKRTCPCSFINSQAFLQGNTNRSSVHLDLALAGKGPETMTIKRLAIG